MSTINGNGNNQTLTSGAIGDIVNGLGGNDTIWGNAGADFLYGGDGNDSLFGGADNDLLQGGAGNDVFDGGDGIDTLDYSNATTAITVGLQTGVATGTDAVGDVFSNVENLIGSGYGDRLSGDSAANVLIGLAGNDTLNGSGGIDTLYGGAGDDVYSVDETADLVSEIGGSGTDSVFSTANYTLGSGLEVLHLIGTLNANGTGNELANALYGNSGTGGFSGFTGDNLLQGLAGNDTIYGYDGVDTLDGGTGNDVMYGGDFDDVYIVDSTGDQVIEITGEGDDTVEASINYTLYSLFVENLTLTGTANLNGTGNIGRNTLLGNDGNNILSGDAGNDSLRGNGGADTLIGGTGNDTLLGGVGNDVYYVDNARDEVVENFGEGIDTVYSGVNGYGLELRVENLVLGSGVTDGDGNAENNVVTGNTIANLLEGEGGNDTLNGDAGNDTMIGGTGIDSMVGGAGDDVYYVDHAGDLVNEGAAGAGYDRVYTTQDFAMTAGIEQVIITSTQDVDATGNELANTLTGGKGDNLLSGLAGNDTILGGEGRDTLIGGAGTNSLTGGVGNDTYVLENLTDSITELALGGIDTVEVAANFALATELENLTLTGTGHFTGSGNAAANRLTGNTGNNALSGGAGNDTIYGGTGNDYLDGGTGNDSMVGGAGEDYYVLDAANDRITELNHGGIDLVEAHVSYTMGSYIENAVLGGAADLALTGNSIANYMSGNAGHNLLAGEGGNDTLIGGAGNDTLNGGSGGDSLSGGTGNDTYIRDSANDVLIEAANEGTDTVISGLAHTLADHFENLTLSGGSGVAGTGNAAANVITGNGGANHLQGMAGNDTLYGGAGADTLNGGAGDDTMAGGAGNDIYYIDQTCDLAVEQSNEGIDTINSIFSTTLSSPFENLILLGNDSLNGTGNSQANAITGNTGDNQLFGMNGNDTLTADAGNDVLDGGSGVDSMIGGLGDDIFYVSSAYDVIVEGSNGGYDHVFSEASYLMKTGLEALTMIGTGNINATGNAYANTLTGNSGDNRLNGGSGADTLYGNLGNDILDGGAANDVMYGGLGDDLYIAGSLGDQVSEADGGGIDTVTAGTHWTLGDGFENLIMASTGAYIGTGNALDNVMTGNKGKNKLLGLDGNDQLNGGAGNDTLTGGNGADQFVFSVSTAGNDTITDFNTLDAGADEGDLLVFSGLEVGSFAYMGDAAFSGGTDNSEARFDSATGRLQIDINGDGTAEFQLILTGLTNASQLEAADFLWS